MEAVERACDPLGREDRLLIGPVHLRLMAGGGLEALLGGAGVFGGPEIPDVALDDLVAAAEAVVARQILVDAGGTERGFFLQPRLDDPLEGVELRGSFLSPTVDRLRALRQIALYGPPVAPHHTGDLGVGETLAAQGVYVHELLLFDHCLLHFLCVALK